MSAEIQDGHRKNCNIKQKSDCSYISRVFTSQKNLLVREEVYY